MNESMIAAIVAEVTPPDRKHSDFIIDARRSARVTDIVKKIYDKMGVAVGEEAFCNYPITITNDFILKTGDWDVICTVLNLHGWSIYSEGTHCCVKPAK